MIYINTKTTYGIETVDQLDKTDFISFMEFRREVKRLLNEYKILGMNVYKSQRPCKDWNKIN
jgi:hypothetical protein